MLLDMFTHFEVNFEEYYKKCGYRQALLQRIEHYNRAKEEALRFKERVDMSRSIPVKVENSRIDRMTDFLRRTDLLSKKI